MEDTEISDQIIILCQDFIEGTFCPLIILVVVCLLSNSDNHNTKHQGLNRPLLLTNFSTFHFVCPPKKVIYIKILVAHFQYFSLCDVNNFPYTSHLLITTFVTSNIVWWPWWCLLFLIKTRVFRLLHITAKRSYVSIRVISEVARFIACIQYFPLPVCRIHRILVWVKIRWCIVRCPRHNDTPCRRSFRNRAYCIMLFISTTTTRSSLKNHPPLLPLSQFTVFLTPSLFWTLTKLKFRTR